MPKGSTKSKAAAVEELDDDDLELIEDEDETPAPKSSKGKRGKTAAPKAEKVESTGYGATWLAEYVNEELNTEYTAAQMRVILRRMAKDGDLEREVGTDRARYSFTGEKDPTVRAVLKRVKSGEVDQAKKDRLEAAQSGKSSANRKKAAVEDDDVEEAPAKPTKKRKAAAAEENGDEAPPKPKATRKRNA